MTSLSDPLIPDSFDPDAPGVGQYGLFGIPIPKELAQVVVIPVAWDVTTSYRPGTARAPRQVLEASWQVDLAHECYPHAWQRGIALSGDVSDWEVDSIRLRQKADHVIAHHERGGSPDDADIAAFIRDINEGCEQMVQGVRALSHEWIQQNRLVGVLGGDHSTPLGLLQALDAVHDSFGILHIDAHLDLRDRYEGFLYSHASIMWHARQLPSVTQMVHVGIRDAGQSEWDLAAQDPRHAVWGAYAIMAQRFEGATWSEQVARILSTLPQKVYVSIDCDGLDIAYSSHTGTPVPGGLHHMELLYLLRSLASSGRELVGFDVVEAGDHPLDAGIAARLLYELSVMGNRSDS